MPRIVDLPDIAAALGAEAAARVGRLFHIERIEGRCVIPPTMVEWTQRQLGDVAQVERQTVVRVVNRVTWDGALYNPAMADGQWLSCPDNVAFDSKGRLWIATDGAPTAAKIADGVWATDTTGKGRALPKLFFQCPKDAELCGPWLTPDDGTLFVGIQHPGESANSTFENPSTRWPDFKDGMPPRPAVVAITRKGGGPLGA